MSVADDVRSRIRTVEQAMKDAGTPAALNAIVDTLKEIAKALDELEQKVRRVAH